jgi:hypothetical protein
MRPAAPVVANVAAKIACASHSWLTSGAPYAV